MHELTCSYIAARAAVIAVSLLIGGILSRSAILNLSMLYFITVLAIMLRFGWWPAILAFIIAFVTFN